MPISIDGSGSITGISTGGLEDGIITPAELSTGGPSWDASGSLQVNSINNGPLAGFRNAIINGNFDIWQRGTSFTNLEYGADRWINNRTGSTCTMSRQAFTLGQADVPGEPTYFCRMAVTSVAGAGNFGTLQHRTEDVRTFAGQQVTISFWAKADATKSIAVELSQNFGTGGSPSTAVEAIGTAKKTLTTSWQKITATATMPSISGKTLGSDGNSHIRFNIWFDAGSNFNSRTNTLGHQSGTFDIAQVQVEAGPVATPFERRPIGTELALCQRYFCKSFPVNKAPVNDNANDRILLGLVNQTVTIDGQEQEFPVAMRQTPTITFYSNNNNVNGLWAFWNGTGWFETNVTEMQVGRITEIGFTPRLVGSGYTLLQPKQLRGHWTASAEL